MGAMGQFEAQESRTDTESGRLRVPRVLVIEDDADLRALIAEVLRGDGFEVVEAENGRVGLELAAVMDPSLILCDVRMPELDGFHTLGEVRRTPRSALVPFVLLSGVGVSAQDVRRGMNLGADDYLLKPFTPEELLETVHARLRRRAAIDTAGGRSGEAVTLPGTVSPADPCLATLDQRFRLVRRVASGGMGTIYEGCDLQTGARVAVKIASLREEGCGPRLEREAQVLASLNDPRIVAFQHFGRTVEGAIYLVMEWLIGKDLQHRIAEGPLSPAEVLALGRRVAGGLGAAHAQGILHRDVKPSNIFLRDGDPSRAVLIDFGIAFIPDATPLTHTGTLLGSLGYLAPEQVFRNEAVDPRADVFSLGCVLFHALTGRGPFSTTNTMAALASVLLDSPTRVESLRPDAPLALCDLIHEMIDRAPHQRPADGNAVLARLDCITA